MNKENFEQDSHLIESTFHPEQRFAFISIKGTLLLIFLVIVGFFVLLLTGKF